MRNINKLIMKLGSFLVLFLLSLQLVACDNKETENEQPEHTHEFSEIKFDETNHWYECSCGEVKDKAVHSGGDAGEYSKAECDICGQEYGGMLAHTHKFSEKARYDETNHWYECSCGEIKDKTEHTYSTDLKYNGLYHWYECSCGAKRDKAEHEYQDELKHDSKEHWYECSCGATDKEEHVFSSEYKYDETNHWYECSCGEIKNKSQKAHSFSSKLKHDATGHWNECSCGAIKNKVEHTFVAEYKYDDTYHWYECSCGEVEEKVLHTGGEGDTPTCEVCGNNYSSIKVAILNAVVMEDVIVDYDGEAHSVLASNVPDGVTVSYKGNEKKNPGQYIVTATFKFEGGSVTKTASLTINYLESVISAEEVQNVVLYGKEVLPKVTVNNDKQTLIYIVRKNGKTLSTAALYNYGTYEVEVYAKTGFGYGESNHVTITLNVVESAYDLKFDSLTRIWDGSLQTLEVSGTLPAGFTVEYDENSGIEAGKYYAVAYIKNASGDVVETLTAVLTIENPENEEFAKFLDEFFVEYLEGDQLSCNIFCEKPEDFGLERYEASWYTYETITEEDIAHDLGVFNEMLDELHLYKDARLTTLQVSAYNTIEDFLIVNIAEYETTDSFFMRNLYVDQFGGYVADFGTYMESYSLRCIEDVKDIINFIDSTSEAFPSYLVYLEEKTAKGYALSDTTINAMRDYLAEILGLIDSDGEKIPAGSPKKPYYLTNVINARIDGVDFLTAEQKAKYKAKVTSEMEASFMVGVKALYDGLEAYLGQLPKSNEGYLTKYDNGKEYYQLQLESLFGLEDFDIDKYIEELDAYFKFHSDNIMRLQNKIITENKIYTYEQLEEYLEQQCIYDGTPEEMIGYLKEFALTIVPELESDPDIYIKEMDEASAKVSNAVAYYMKSALDNTAGEYITLNPTKLGGKNDVLSTMAHEGYPGHLYAYVRSKELDLSNAAKVMTSTAHAEGWATYVSLQLFKYAKDNSNSQKFKNVMDYYIANESLGHILEARLDVGILYEGWNVSRVKSFLDSNGYNGDAAQEIYDLIIEMPAVYPAYGYGKMFFVKLHDEAKSVLGNYYDEVEFNDMLLSKGWTDLGELKNTYIDYMMVKCHEVGVEFNSSI